MQSGTAAQWRQKYNKEVGLHEEYPTHCLDERYKIIATPINSKKIKN